MGITAEQTKASQLAFLAAFEKSRGNIKEACKIAGVGRRTFYHWIEQDKGFTAEYEDAFEGAKDDVEQILLAIGAGVQKGGNPSALMGWLNARAKERGYARFEHTGGGGGPIIFEIVDFAARGKGPDPGKV